MTTASLADTAHINETETEKKKFNNYGLAGSET